MWNVPGKTSRGERRQPTKSLKEALQRACVPRVMHSPSDSGNKAAPPVGGKLDQCICSSHPRLLVNYPGVRFILRPPSRGRLAVPKMEEGGVHWLYSGSQRVLAPNTPPCRVLRARMVCQLTGGISRKPALPLRPLGLPVLPMSRKEAPKAAPKPLSGLSDPCSLQNWSLREHRAHPCPSLGNQADRRWGSGSDLHSQALSNELLTQREKEKWGRTDTRAHKPIMCACVTCTHSPHMHTPTRAHPPHVRTPCMHTYPACAHPLMVHTPLHVHTPHMRAHTPYMCTHTSTCTHTPSHVHTPSQVHTHPACAHPITCAQPPHAHLPMCTPPTCTHTP